MAHALFQLRTWLAAVLPARDDDRAATVVEYAMLLAMIAVVCLVAVNLIGEPVSTGLSNGGDGFRP
jgi:Flp pilus assembly pilin Flp